MEFYVPFLGKRQSFHYILKKKLLFTQSTYLSFQALPRTDG